MGEEGEEEAAALGQNRTEMWDNTVPKWLSDGWPASLRLPAVTQTHKGIFFIPSFLSFLMCSNFNNLGKKSYQARDQQTAPGFHLQLQNLWHNCQVHKCWMRWFVVFCLPLDLSLSTSLPRLKLSAGFLNK